MEWMEFFQGLFETANIVSVVAVLALVWLWGQLGLSGIYQLLSSFATGVLIGVLDRFAEGGLVDFRSWFYAVLYGIILGALASGFYEAIKKAVINGSTDALGLDEDIHG